LASQIGRKALRFSSSSVISLSNLAAYLAHRWFPFVFGQHHAPARLGPIPFRLILVRLRVSPAGFAIIIAGFVGPVVVFVQKAAVVV
jgi:hypothetical protein